MEKSVWHSVSLPKPFSRVVLMLGEPILVSRETSDEEFEKLFLVAESRLNEITEKVDRHKYA